MAERVKVAALGLAHDHVWSNLRALKALDNAVLVAGADGNAELREQICQANGL